MKILVTGGAGFVGSHLVERLLAQGEEVRVLDNFSTGKLDNLLSSQRLEIKSGDVKNKKDCEQACKGISIVFHLAAKTNITQSLKDPEDCYETNISGTLNMLQAAYHHNVKRFVFASSGAIYGLANNLPLDEKTTPYPITAYAISKLAGEHYCYLFAQEHGIESVSLRYANIYGPKQTIEKVYPKAIPTFIQCAFNDDPYPIYGEGTQTRDFVYIDDVIDVTLSASILSNISSHVFNIASGQSTTLLKVGFFINKLMGKSLRPMYGHPRRGEQDNVVMDISLARAFLNYHPKVSFEEGLRLTVQKWKKSSS